jgi:hypothetical protein
MCKQRENNSLLRSLNHYSPSPPSLMTWIKHDFVTYKHREIFGSNAGLIYTSKVQLARHMFMHKKQNLDHPEKT